MKRSAFCMYSLVILLFVCFLFPGNRAEADSLYVKKMISLVLDDSGSMDNGNRWEYALYALQNLAAMMNPEDRLYVTTLSSNQPIAFDVSDQGIAYSINQIRSIVFGDGDTPFTPVMTAFEHLKNQPAEESSTEYWLIVLTDGRFANIPASCSSLEQALSSFTSETMPNGSRAKVIYLNIGNTTNEVTSRPESNLYSYSAPGSGAVIEAMAQISDMISGRKRFERKDVLFSDSRTLSVISPSLPLANLIVLVQNSDAEISQVVSDTGQHLRTARTVNAFTALKKKSLFSFITRIEGNGENIQPGTYTFTFDRPVDTDHVTVLYEPALEVQLLLSINGTEVTKEDLARLVVGDRLAVGYRIYEAGTNRELPLSLLSGARAGVVLRNGEQIVAEGGQSPLETVLAEGSQTLSAWLAIPGFRNLEDSVSFSPATVPLEIGMEGAEEITLTVGQYRHLENTITITCTEYYDQGSSLTQSRTLSTKQQLLDRDITIRTSLAYDAEKLLGEDGLLHILLSPQPDITAGTYPIDIYWGGKLNKTLNVIIIPSTYTISIQPAPVSVPLSEFINQSPVYIFTLTEDGLWDASCREHDLKITSTLSGATVTFDEQGRGQLSFTGRENTLPGAYSFAAAITGGTLEGNSTFSLEISEPVYDISLSETRITRKQSELNKEIRIIAKLTKDGAVTAFPESGWSAEAGGLNGQISGVLQEDGTLLLTVQSDIRCASGDYPIRLSAKGATADCTLSVSASDFAITAEPAALSLISDHLSANTEAFRFSVTADQRALSAGEIRLLNPQFTAPTTANMIAYGETEVLFTPVLSEQADLPADGEHAVEITLSNGTKGSATLLLRAIVYTLIPQTDALSIAREMLVGNREHLSFSVTRDGRKMTREEVIALAPTVEMEPKGYERWVEMQTEVTADGSILLTPFRTGWKGIASLTPLGEMTVRLKIRKNEGQAVIQIHRGDFLQEWLPYRIVPVLLLLLLIGEIFKKRFHYPSRLYVYSPAYARGGILTLNATDWFSGSAMISPACVIPFMADRLRIRGTGIRVKANGSIFRNILLYAIPEKTSLTKYYLLESDEIQPYESGKINIAHDLELLNPEEELSGRGELRWRSLRAGMRLVVFNDSYYSIYLFR